MTPIPSLYPHVMAAIERRGLSWQEDKSATCPGIMFCCPVHNDRSPSAKLWLREDGSLVMGCFVCDTRSNPNIRLAMIDALGLKPSSFFPSPRSWDKQTKELLPAFSYEYRDEKGIVRYRSCRYDRKRHDGTPCKDFAIQRWEGGRWLAGLGQEKPLLYRLPELLSSPKEAMVFWCEGENKVEKLSSIGLIATSLHGGSNAPYHAHFDPWLAGRHICFLPDKAQDSEQMVWRIAGRLMLEGIVASIRITRLDGLCSKQDVWDWIGVRQFDRTKEEIRKEFLKEVKASPSFRRAS